MSHTQQSYSTKFSALWAGKLTPSEFKADIKKLVLAFFNSYANIFFIRHPLAGMLLAALTLLNYNAGISGILAVISSYFIACFFNYQQQFLKAEYFAYNALLAGLGIGFLFKLSLLSLLIIVIAGALSFIITYVTAHTFSRLLGLQVLSVPFVIVSTLIYLSAHSFTNLFVVSLYVPAFSLDLGIFPYWFSGYLKSLGAIIFMPNEITGLVIATILLFYSRILFFLSLSGYLSGIVLYGLLSGSILAASQDISGFNYILIAMALGGIFNIPSFRTIILALSGVAMATIIASAGNVFWSQYGLPIFTLPFTLITLGFVYLSITLELPFRTRFFIGNPEQNLDYHVSSHARFVDNPVALSLPFSGQWYVWQGFNGPWTHQGIYQYAYDFVIKDTSDNTFAHQGHYLTDYYCYNKEVLSPVNGKVVQVVNHLPDNIIGSVDTQNPWGNFVLIQDERGFYIKIAHLAHQSLAVVEGQSVSVGTYLGLCGNSGNSPQPHLHIQAQSSLYPTAPTLPFIFVNYVQQQQMFSHGLPEENQTIEQCGFNPFLDQLTNFVLDEVYYFQVYKNDQPVDTLELKVKMSESLFTYFETDKGRLYFGKQYGQFYFYSCEGHDPYLKLINLALSSLPVSNVQSYTWKDSVNNSLILSRWQMSIASLLNTINNQWVTTESQYQFVDDTCIKGSIHNAFFNMGFTTCIETDPVVKFKKIQVNNYTLEQIPHPHLKQH